MKRNYLMAASYTLALLFAAAAIASPLDAAATRKNRTEKREAAGEENTVTKEKTNPAAEKEPEGEGTAPSLKEKHEGGGIKTEGVPSKEYRDDDFKPAVEEESTAWMFIKMLLVLGIFAGGFYYFYRFVTRKTGVNLFGGEAVRVLSVVPLGQNKFLQIVDLAGKLLVIGVSDNSINLITEVTDRDQVDRIRILSMRTPPPERAAGGFQDQVVREIGKIIGRVRDLRRKDRGTGTTAADNAADMEYMRLQKNRLQKMNGVDDE
jgi:flagellar protein FliO/FliZ